MHIVLLEPEIPQNAGNIARTCAVTNSVLHLIKPLGFSVEDKYLKRAGLDYWKLLDIRYYENFEDFCERNPNAKIWMASTKARHIYADVTYGENDYIMFGKESAGICCDGVSAKKKAGESKDSPAFLNFAIIRW